MTWYTPDAEGSEETQSKGDVHVAGVWPFEVNTVEEATSKKGNEMLKLELTAATINGDARCYAYLVKTPKAAWKIKEFLLSAGLDTKKPQTLEAFESAKGVARFIVGERGYLEVEEFLPAGTQISISELMGDNNVPF